MIRTLWVTRLINFRIVFIGVYLLKIFLFLILDTIEAFLIFFPKNIVFLVLLLFRMNFWICDFLINFIVWVGCIKTTKILGLAYLSQILKSNLLLLINEQDRIRLNKQIHKVQNRIEHFGITEDILINIFKVFWAQFF